MGVQKKGNSTGRVKEGTQKHDTLKVYFANSRKGIEEELRDEEPSLMLELVEEATEEEAVRLEGEGSSSVNPSDIEKLTGDEKQIWISAMKA